jgi:hypothetical protein
MAWLKLAGLFIACVWITAVFKVFVLDDDSFSKGPYINYYAPLSFSSPPTAKKAAAPAAPAVASSTSVTKDLEKEPSDLVWPPVLQDGSINNGFEIMPILGLKVTFLYLAVCVIVLLLL